MTRTVSPSAIAVATEDEVRRHVFKDNSVDAHTDEELDALVIILNGVSAAIERYIGGPVVTREFTEKYDGGGEMIFLAQRPVVSVTSVTEEGEPLVECEDYYVYAKEGYLLRASGGGALWWAKGYTERGGTGAWTTKPQGVEVTYTAGRATQTIVDGTLTAVNYTDPSDEGIRLAALLWIDAIFKTGPANITNLISEGAVLRPDDMPPQVRKLLSTFVVPRLGSI